MNKKCQDKRKKKIVVENSNNISMDDVRVIVKVFSKRCVIAPLLFMLMYMLDHPSQQFNKIIHKLLVDVLFN